jgi:hypothetical protein
MSKTDMVRCKGLVETARVLIVDVMNKEPELDENIEESGGEIDPEEDAEMDADEQKFEMDVAGLYEQTFMQLGEQLDGNGGFGVVS